MALDTAAKRRSAAAIFVLFAVGVTPDATPGGEWRQQAGWGYSGIAAGEAATEVLAAGDLTTALSYWMRDRPVPLPRNENIRDILQAHYSSQSDVTTLLARFLRERS